jgi:hypothetical protein
MITEDQILLSECIANFVGDRVEKILLELAIPKPPRIAEKYAALTLSIVLLREQVMSEVGERRVVK